MWKVTAFVAQSVALGLAVAFVAVLIEPDLINRAAPANSSPASYAQAVAASAPAVVIVYADTVSPVPNALGRRVRGRELGSGVIIDRDGHIVTNYHVIEGADEIGVQLADGRVAIPELVGTDPDTELALLRIDLPNLPDIRLGRSDTLEVGEIVLAIGNSLGLTQTVTMGIVSATGRGQLGVTAFEDFIQTDAAINVGNSGGALVNARGELVGINTAVISTAPEAMPEGLGFAIPVNLVRGVMRQLIANGRVIRGYLGVDDARELPAAQARILGIEGSAVLITKVSGPAEAAGLRPGDVLTHLNGERIFTRQQATNLVASTQPGGRLRIRVTRPSGSSVETVETEAVLEEAPPGTRRLTRE
ncbi:MAG TPA: trypsin-like peptidase domain-containing protein [Gammaproteobacteria bacterium]|nr:trypsin-like peptidase domain-containing protein [Gammaproteobacteria bacterium]